MSWYKKASKYGVCLKKALELIKNYPSLKLMMGPPGRPEDTAHFWTVDQSGNIHDHASEVVPKDYPYKGKEVDAKKIQEELDELNKTAAVISIPTKEDVKEIQQLIEKIKAGKPSGTWTSEELQLQQNFPEIIEELLRRCDQ